MASEVKSGKLLWEIHLVQRIHHSEKLKFSTKKNCSLTFKKKNDIKEINGKDIKNVLDQNNCANHYLETIGDQLGRIENIVQKPTSQILNKNLKSPDKKPLFKPHGIVRNMKKQLANKEFMNEIDKRLAILESQVVPNTPILPSSTKRHSMSNEVNPFNHSKR